MTIGVRREDKNRWERRVPLTPADLADLQARHDLRFLVQPSSIRTYADDDYRAAGVEIAEDLAPASLVVAVKEIPVELLRPGTIYVFFSHVIKGQPHNMPMLRRLLELGCTLVDYEKITDERNRRLIFFGVHAGYAGMIETLWCLGRRLHARGLAGPFDGVRHAYEYEGLEAAKRHLGEIGERVRDGGLEQELRPIVFGLAGYGNVSRGCREILDCLGVAEIPVESLPKRAARNGAAAPPLLAVVFKEEHMVVPAEPGARFELQDYYDRPQRYRGCFERHLPHLDVLVNTIYWDKRYPRLVTREWARRSHRAGQLARLQVIGDISCDVEGAVELTLRTTQPDAPCYTYDPQRDAAAADCDGRGPAIMAVDNLPCELPRESSQQFSAALREMIPPLARAEWSNEFERLELPPHLKQAVIVHRGRLTPNYRHLREFLNR